MQLTLFDKESLVTTQNLPLGALRIRQLLSGIPANMSLTMDLIGEIVDNELFTFRKIHLKDREIKNIIGIGKNTLYLFRGEQEQLPEKIDREAVDRSYDRLLTMGLEAIADRLGVNTEYAKLLLPSAVIYKKILEITGAENI